MNPLWCIVCGIRPAMFNESRCEDCWADDQYRYRRRKIGNIHTMVYTSLEMHDVPIQSETRAARRRRDQRR
jgi:hypothetical protein